MSISASNPLEAVLYLKLLKHQKDLVDTVSSFIISNEQVWFFFDSHRDSLRNVNSHDLKVLTWVKTGQEAPRDPRATSLQGRCTQNKQVIQEE